MGQAEQNIGLHEKNVQQAKEDINDYENMLKTFDMYGSNDVERD